MRISKVSERVVWNFEGAGRVGENLEGGGTRRREFRSFMYQLS